MTPEVKAFTASSKNIQRVLTSPCKVSKAYDSNTLISPPTFIDYIGIWDTGATGTVITQKVVSALGLVPIGKTIAHHANGTAIVNEYFINLILPNNVEIQVLKVIEGVFGEGVDLLIGMDVISQGDFAVTNFNGKTTFTFRIPSLSEIDFVKISGSQNNQVANNKPKIDTTKKIGRNDLCACGSGKKYKQCCLKSK